MARRTKEEWNQLVMECRQSGLSDRQWCLQNDIPHTTLYYHIRRMRNDACESVPLASTIKAPVVQDVVEITFQDEPVVKPSVVEMDMCAPAIVMDMNGLSIQIYNTASKATVANTLLAIKEIC